MWSTLYGIFPWFALFSQLTLPLVYALPLYVRIGTHAVNRFKQLDVNRYLEEENNARFNVVMSDMAPKTTGRESDAEESAELCKQALNIAMHALVSKASLRREKEERR